MVRTSLLMYCRKPSLLAFVVLGSSLEAKETNQILLSWQMATFSIVSYFVVTLRANVEIILCANLSENRHLFVSNICVTKNLVMVNVLVPSFDCDQYFGMPLSLCQV